MTTTKPALKSTPQPQTLSFLDRLIWTVLGLMLTVVGTFIEAVVALPEIFDAEGNLQLPTNLAAVGTIPLPVSFQVAAVLFVGCMGGKFPATLSQMAYLGLGLSGYQIFSQGGGLSYWQEPTFGYLLGFIPAAWFCGQLAFQQPPRIERLFLSCLAGLGVIHGCGLVYLVGLSLGQLLPLPLPSLIQQYSLNPLPGQLVITCLVAVAARMLRFVLIY